MNKKLSLIWNKSCRNKKIIDNKSFLTNVTNNLKNNKKIYMKKYNFKKYKNHFLSINNINNKSKKIINSVNLKKNKNNILINTDRPVVINIFNKKLKPKKSIPKRIFNKPNLNTKNLKKNNQNFKRGTIMLKTISSFLLKKNFKMSKIINKNYNNYYKDWNLKLILWIKPFKKIKYIQNYIFNKIMPFNLSIDFNDKYRILKILNIPKIKPKIKSNMRLSYNMSIYRVDLFSIRNSKIKLQFLNKINHQVLDYKSYWSNIIDSLLDTSNLFDMISEIGYYTIYNSYKKCSNKLINFHKKIDLDIYQYNLILNI